MSTLRVGFSGGLSPMSSIHDGSLAICRETGSPRAGFMNEQGFDPSNPPRQPDLTESSAVPTISAQDLLQGHKEILIDHQGEIYRLRVTSRGRLILQK